MKKWELQKDDIYIAFSYIFNKIKNNSLFELKDINFELEALKEFEPVKKELTIDKDNFYLLLKNWIEKYLDDEQINKLRIKIRVEKSRRGKDKKQITLKGDTHYRLAEFAKRYNITLSEAIDKLLKLAQTT